MKKYLSKIILSILFISFVLPSIALASWWNPFSWNWKALFNSPKQTNVIIIATSTATSSNQLQDTKSNVSYDQICHKTSGLNSFYSGHKNSDGSLICSCNTGYEWQWNKNSNSPVCQVIQAQQQTQSTPQPVIPVTQKQNNNQTQIKALEQQILNIKNQYYIDYQNLKNNLTPAQQQAYNQEQIDQSVYDQYVAQHPFDPHLVQGQQAIEQQTIGLKMQALQIPISTDIQMIQIANQQKETLLQALLDNANQKIAQLNLQIQQLQLNNQ